MTLSTKALLIAVLCVAGATSRRPSKKKNANFKFGLTGDKPKIPGGFFELKGNLAVDAPGTKGPMVLCPTFELWGSLLLDFQPSKDTCIIKGTATSTSAGNAIKKFKWITGSMTVSGQLRSCSFEVDGDAYVIQPDASIPVVSLNGDEMACSQYTSSLHISKTTHQISMKMISRQGLVGDLDINMAHSGGFIKMKSAINIIENGRLHTIPVRKEGSICYNKKFKWDTTSSCEFSNVYPNLPPNPSGAPTNVSNTTFVPGSPTNDTYYNQSQPSSLFVEPSYYYFSNIEYLFDDRTGMKTPQSFEIWVSNANLPAPYEHNDDDYVVIVKTYPSTSAPTYKVMVYRRDPASIDRDSKFKLKTIKLTDLEKYGVPGKIPYIKPNRSKKQKKKALKKARKKALKALKAAGGN